MKAILLDLFGPGTWGTSGNLVASAILTVPAIVIAHVRSYRQRQRHQDELKQHVTKATGGADGGREATRPEHDPQ